jgi:hypothetical protein
LRAVADARTLFRKRGGIELGHVAKRIEYASSRRGIITSSEQHPNGFALGCGLYLFTLSYEGQPARKWMPAGTGPLPGVAAAVAARQRLF